MVGRYIDELQGTATDDDTANISANATNPILDDVNYPFAEFFRSLDPLDVSSYSASKLQNIISRIHEMTKVDILVHLSAYLLEIFPPPKDSYKPKPNVHIRLDGNKRQQRRREYATTQINFKKHQGRCIRSILEGPNNSTIPSRDIMEPYWRAVFENTCDDAPPITSRKMVLESIWTPITAEELACNRLKLSTSPGPDGITSRQLRAIPADILVRIINIILLCEQLPEYHRAARTVFLPKKLGATEPGEFRP
ncbi:hypothetical protein KPH14_013024, partial [Odynerus spinipes]